MALPRQNRLGSSRDFGRVHRKGNRAATQNLAIRALKPAKLTSAQSAARLAKTPINKGLTLKKPLVTQVTPSQDTARQDTARQKTLRTQSVEGKPSALPSCFGISISRKVSKRAVVRNRIKRQIKAIIRQDLPQIEPGWQVVIVVRPAAVECEFDDFLRELEYLLKKLRVLAP